MEPKIALSIQPASLDVITTPEWAEASRKLIALHAAAPELLAALKEANETLTRLLPVKGALDGHDRRVTVHAVRAAIAKAEGV